MEPSIFGPAAGAWRRGGKRDGYRSLTGSKPCCWKTVNTALTDLTVPYLGYQLASCPPKHTKLFCRHCHMKMSRPSKSGNYWQLEFSMGPWFMHWQVSPTKFPFRTGAGTQSASRTLCLMYRQPSGHENWNHWASINQVQWFVGSYSWDHKPKHRHIYCHHETQLPPATWLCLSFARPVPLAGLAGNRAVSTCHTENWMKWASFSGQTYPNCPWSFQHPTQAFNIFQSPPISILQTQTWPSAASRPPSQPGDVVAFHVTYRIFYSSFLVMYMCLIYIYTSK